jgi:hypothetical protein
VFLDLAIEELPFFDKRLLETKQLLLDGVDELAEVGLILM